MPKLTKAKLAAYRKRLLEILEELGVKLEHMEDSVLRAENETSPDEVDEFSSENYSQEFQIDMIENEEKILREVYDAVERLDNGTFGACESCGAPIPEMRLEILPYARYCVPCQRNAEESEEKEAPIQPPPPSDPLG
ncbi:MAG: TraR/DksA family transcriptional regulator [Planctomycetota bacterium]|nr:MAG: TraR/DksA family transcriptional regulator [Planctomycetota bacterium]